MKHILKKMAAAVLCLTVGITSSICDPMDLSAKDNIVPDYEVKFLLDSDQVLNSEHLLQKTYRNLFETGKEYETIGVLYLDTAAKEFHQQGWGNRMRIKQDADVFELTYKKRYAVSGEDITAALTLANREGFDISDTNYSAQIDWGYSNMTLSLSCQKTVSNQGYNELELPKRKDAIEIMSDKMPGKEIRWLYDGWGIERIEDAKKIGPVYYDKYVGKYKNKKIVVEIWPIEEASTGRIEYLTELSFKADTYEEAAALRMKLMDGLDELGILLHKDSLKMQKILNAYVGE